MSEKSLAERLQVKRERRLAVVDAPDGLGALTGPHQSHVEPPDAEVVLFFAKDRAALEAKLTHLLETIASTAIFWLAYPKLSSKQAADLNRDTIRVLAPDYGLDTVGQISVDDDWSALRLKRIA